MQIIVSFKLIIQKFRIKFFGTRKWLIKISPIIYIKYKLRLLSSRRDLFWSCKLDGWYLSMHIWTMFWNNNWLLCLFTVPLIKICIFQVFSYFWVFFNYKASIFLVKMMWRIEAYKFTHFPHLSKLCKDWKTDWDFS